MCLAANSPLSTPLFTSHFYTSLRNINQGQQAAQCLARPDYNNCMVAMSEGRASALLKKLVLRLDDGTVIRGGGGEGEAPAAVVLKPAAAYAAGALTEAHLLKAQALLCEVHAKLPEEGPLREHLLDRIAMTLSADVASTFEQRVNAVESATRFQDRPQEMLDEAEETTDNLRTQVGGRWWWWWWWWWPAQGAQQ